MATAALLGCAARPPVAPVPAAPASPPAAYRLVPGDVIDVKFYYNPELNESVPIRPDGLVSLQLVGDVPASGRTPAELAEALGARYATRLPHPEVGVIVKQFTAQQVYVGGEVLTPGPVPLHGRLTSVQALIARGGPKATAEMHDVIVIRYVSPDAATAQRFDLTRVVHGTAADVELHPYDIVYVPMTPIAQLDQFVEQYVNQIIPRSVSFPFPYNLNPRFEVVQ